MQPDCPCISSDSARIALQLLVKQEESDRRLDLAFRESSVTHAWSQIKGILHAELAERRNAVYKLTHGVVEPLVAFKVCVCHRARS